MADKASGGGAKLSRERVVAAAMDIADRGGMEVLTIRALATELGTKPMSIYYYVDNKDALQAAMVEEVFGLIDDPDPSKPWKDAIRDRCVSAREVLGAHPWAIRLLETGDTPGPASLAHHEAVVACLIGAGMPIAVVAHAYAILDSFIYGFVVQESGLPVQSADDAEVAASVSSAFDPEAYPSLLRLTMEHVMQPDYAFADSFDFGLDLILDGLERAFS